MGEIFSLLYQVEGAAYALLKRLARSVQPAQSHQHVCEFTDVALAENEFAYPGKLVVNLFGGIQ